ncbi:MAG: hypothetical protein ACOX7R_01115 [Acetivibrionales bacterium]|jgi:hypothetical protein
MVEVYYYIPLEKVSTSIDCGIKLSESYDKEVLIEGDRRKCLSALLNPRDDIEKYRSKELKCVKLEVQPRYCFIAEKCFYQVGLNFPNVMDMYIASIIPIEKYKFGFYRMPECLVTSTVIGGHITLLNKGLDSPILFESSELLYTNNIIEIYRENYPDINDAMLYCFFSKLAEIKKFDKIEDNSNGLSIFIDKESGNDFTIKIPDIHAY